MNKSCRKHLGITLSLFLAISVLISGSLILSAPSIGHAQSLGDFFKGIKKALENKEKEYEGDLHPCDTEVLGASPEQVSTAWTHCAGTVAYDDGSKYVGEWKDGKWHGQGTMTYADGRVEEGIWKDGIFQGDQERQQRTAQERYKRTGSLRPCPGTPAVEFSAWKSWTNCVGTRFYLDRSKYVGEWKDGKWHGQGTMTYADGRVEEGIWKDGIFQGDQERQQRTAQERYKRTGSLRPCPGSPTRMFSVYKKWTNCVGTRSSSLLGTKYVGEWKNGRWHGQGTLTHADGRVQEGIWKNDEFQGNTADIRRRRERERQQRIAEAQRRERERKQRIADERNRKERERQRRVAEERNRKEREQQQRIAEARRRERERQRQIAQETQKRRSSLPPCPGSPTTEYSVWIKWTNCVGTLTFTSGDKYVGEFRNGKGHGQGTYFYASGSKYVGEYKDGKPNGHFVATFSNGDKYVGEYRNGKRHGQGTYYFLADNQFKGDKYVGEHKDGKFKGQGTYTFASGNKYVGEFRNSVRNGQGTYTFADGRVLEGIFKNGAFQYAKKAPSPRRAQNRRAEKRRRKKEERLARLEGELKRKEARLRKREKAFEKKKRQSRTARRTPSLAPPQRGWDAKGSGIYLKGSTHILTNLHVVRTANKLRISFPSGEKYSGEVIVRDVNNDVAIVELRGMNQKRGGFTVNLNADIDAGMEVYAIGYPLNSGINIVDGIVSSTTGLDRNISKFTMTAPINEGNSGGPVIDENGNLVGIAQSGLVQRGVENVRFGTKISTTVHALKQAKLSRQFNIQVRRRKRKFSSREIFKRYSPYVVRIDVK